MTDQNWIEKEERHTWTLTWKLLILKLIQLIQAINSFYYYLLLFTMVYSKYFHWTHCLLCLFRLCSLIFRLFLFFLCLLFIPCALFSKFHLTQCFAAFFLVPKVPLPRLPVQVSLFSKFISYCVICFCFFFYMSSFQQLSNIKIKIELNW